MKIEKKSMDHPVRIWIVCNWFFRLDISVRVQPGKNCSGIITIRFETKKLTEWRNQIREYCSARRLR